MKETNIRLTILYIILLLSIVVLLTNCGKIQVQTKSEPIEVRVSGSVTALILTSVVNDPKINALIADKCMGDSACANLNQSEILTSITQGLTSLGGIK